MVLVQEPVGGANGRRRNALRTLLGLSAELRSALALFDPALASGEDCATLVEELARTEKACQAARSRAAARAGACGAHRVRGYADAPAWLAAATGSTCAEAKEAMEGAEAVSALPGTAEAVASGDVSLRQGAAIARAEQEAPGAEAGLLELARHAGLSVVRDQARRLALAAQDPEALAARQRKARQFRHWADEMGMVRFSGALTPVEGAAVISRIEHLAARLRREAGRAGAEEAFQAFAADALVTLLADRSPAGSGTDAKRPRSEVVFLCDLEAYRRGHAHEGEAVRVLGGSPVPVSVIDDAMRDAFVKAVLYRGKDVVKVAHFGRYYGAHLLTALQLGSPPDFEGPVCPKPGCGRRFGLERDHVVPVAANGTTSLENLELACKPEHRLKTERDRRAGLLGPGGGEWRKPKARGRGDDRDPPAVTETGYDP